MLALNHYLTTLLLCFPFLTSAALFPRLYVSSYDGNVTTLVLTHNSSTSYEYGRPINTTTSCNLTALSRIPCAADPSWLTFDSRHRRLYCIGEDLLGKKGGLTVFETLPSGELKTLSTTDIGPGAVNSVLHGAPGNASVSALVLANFSGSVLTYNIFPPVAADHSQPLSQSPTSISAPASTHSSHPASPPTLVQNLPFTLASPGPVAGRQLIPHPHQVILDPSRQYVLSPDLGADLVRVFRIQNGTGILLPCEHLKVTPGTGARHVAFWRRPADCAGGKAKRDVNVVRGLGGDEGRPQRVMKRAEHGSRQHRERGMKRAEQADGLLFMYLVGELGNTISTFAVTYPPGGGMEFDLRGTIDTFGGKGVPAGAAAAEIAVSGNHLIVSNRNDFSFPANATSSSSPGASDSLATFAIGHNGTLSFTSLSSAGGVFPRSFSLNRAGDLMAVGLQWSNKVVVIQRDVQTGKMGDIVAEVGGLGNVTCVVWDEQYGWA